MAMAMALPMAMAMALALDISEKQQREILMDPYAKESFEEWCRDNEISLEDWGDWCEWWECWKAAIDAHLASN